MQYPNRKSPRLKGYDYSATGAYFITICTHEKQKLFDISPAAVGNDLRVVPNDAPQNQIIKKWLFELQNKFNINIDRYVIMADHIHFILFINKERHIGLNTERHTGRSLPDMMQWFKTMTTNDYINSVKKSILKPFNKKLWQKSYYDHIIRDEEDYKTRCKYIEENPAKLIELTEGEPHDKF